MKKRKKHTYTRTEVIGTVDTDSALLMLVDPTLIKEQDLHGSSRGMVFWGKDMNILTEKLVSSGFKVEPWYGGEAMIVDDLDREMMASFIRISQQEKLNITIEYRTGTLKDITLEATCQPNLAGNFYPPSGLKGGVSLAVGRNGKEGRYDVVAHYIQDIDGTERIADIQVIFIKPEEVPVK